MGEIIAVKPVEVSWGADWSAPTSTPSSSKTADPVSQDALGRRLTVAFGGPVFSDLAIGDSIAINGACMTVVAFDDKAFQVDVSRESLNRTVGLDQTGRVNLEQAMRAGDRLGGHLVSGHVDGTGVIKELSPVGESMRLVVEVPSALAVYVSDKGSVALDGVSLTVNTVTDSPQGTDITVNLIPHTWQSTTLQFRKPGDRLNIEVDQVAKQVERILARIQLNRIPN